MTTTVWAVMRGRLKMEFHGLYATEELAEQQAKFSNETFPRGDRYRAVELVVKDAAAVAAEAGSVT